MPTQSVDRAVGGTEVLRFLMSLICDWINWFIEAEIRGRCKEGFVEHTVHLVQLRIQFTSYWH